ncbi:MAG: hypothetical protein JW953_01565 [Anaerolineae bacterium]|nr:hypothetical protein [Anaerolineae bacterium]
MTTNHHTAIATGASRNAAIINSPLGELDAAIDAVTNVGSSFPGSPGDGDLCYRTDLDALYIYNGSDWREVGIRIGEIRMWCSNTAPDGWLLTDGKTVGSASSGGTALADDDAEELFTFLWTNFDNTTLTIQNSSGTPTTRGASAAADFAANKRMPLPDLRGRAPVGQDDMGGTSANRVTAAAADLMGGVGGAETVTLDTTMIPAHPHSSSKVLDGSALAITDANYDLFAEAGASRSDALTGSTGGGGAHANMMPYYIINFIIYTGVL